MTYMFEDTRVYVSDDEDIPCLTNMCEETPDYTSGDEAMVAYYFPKGAKACSRALTIEIVPNETFASSTDNYFLDVEANCTKDMCHKGYIHPTPSERLTDPIWMQTVDDNLDKTCRACWNGTCTCCVDKYIRWVKANDYKHFGDGFLYYPDK
jgi:hypothetical protein